MFEKKNSFSLLISLFLQIYKNKELCPLLMEKFKEMNIKKKENENYMDKNKDLEKYKKNFNQISAEADNLIKRNGYDPIQFYGIILCYLNNYEQKTFMAIFNKLVKENLELLYEILLIYSSHFSNPSFIFSFDKAKDQIANIIQKNLFKNIELSYIAKGNYEEIENIIFTIESIINYSKEKKILLIYFTSNFWSQILKNYNKINDYYISISFRLRKIFIKYNDFINNLYKNNKKSNIKVDINKYFDKDEFSFFLDKNIRKYLEINKYLSNADILGYIHAFNPYYKDERYKYNRDTYIFDYLNINNNNNQFIKTFKKLEFEIIFKYNITEFLKKMVSKIRNISNFGTIIDLISFKKISQINDYLSLLNNKYELVIKRKIDSLKGKKEKEAIKIIGKFFDLLYINGKNFKFIEDKIDKYDKKVIPYIYHELLKRCKGNEYKKMKDFIFSKLNIDIVIYLIDNLDKKEQNDFFEEIMDRCKFTKEEYFSNNENTKIILLYDLYEKGKLKKNNEENYYIDIEPLLSEIIDDMEGEIGIKKIEEFLKNEEIAIKKLGFIKIILRYFNPEEYYKDLKKIIEDINRDINDLTYIKDLIQIFHRVKYRKEIKTLVEIIKDLQEKSIKNYKTQKLHESIKPLKELKTTADQVKQYKDFLFFKVLYDEAYGNDQEKRFNEALKNLEIIKSEFDSNPSSNEIYKNTKDIINKIKEIISNDESKANEFIKKMIDYFEIKDKNELIEELTLIFKSKKYEMDLKSIIYFFDNLTIDNNKDDWNKKLSSKYKKLSEMDLEDLKKNLKELKKNEIYDYENNNIYSKLFTSLYDKKQAIDFLLSKNNQDINLLYDRIDPTNPSITMANIQDTEECIKIFNEFKKLNNNFKIFNYIKSLDNNQISKFENFSKNYISIIELDRNDDSSLNLYQQVIKIIQNANFIFSQDSVDFSYGEKNEINIKELIHLKNKIHIKPSKETK